jgi:hypothetical protein
LVDGFRHGQWLRLLSDEPFLGLGAQIQFLLTVNAIDPFVIPIATTVSNISTILNIASPLINIHRLKTTRPTTLGQHR